MSSVELSNTLGIMSRWCSIQVLGTGNQLNSGPSPLHSVVLSPFALLSQPHPSSAIDPLLSVFHLVFRNGKLWRENPSFTYLSVVTAAGEWRLGESVSYTNPESDGLSYGRIVSIFDTPRSNLVSIVGAIVGSDGSTI
jgi:hypothetical protein